MTSSGCSPRRGELVRSPEIPDRRSEQPREFPHFRYVFAVLLVAVALCAYWPSFSGVFVFDDIDEILLNQKIRSLQALSPQLLHTGRPVVYATLWLNYQIGEYNVFGYHLFNFAIHLASGLLLFGIVVRTLQLPRFSRRYGQSSRYLAAAIAVIWTIHPLQTQAVTYVVQRCESLMGFFYLLTLYCLIRGATAIKHWPWYLAGIAACWFGMGTKEVMITSPMVLLLFDRIFLSDSWRHIVRTRWWFYLGMAAAAAWLLFFHFLLPHTDPAAGPGDVSAHAGFACRAVTPWQYLVSQPGVILHYLRLAILPDALCFDYRWPVATGWFETIAPGVVVGLLILASLTALHRRPALAFLGLSFFLILLPTSSILPIADLAVEHRMYLPLAPLVCFLVLAAHWCLCRSPGQTTGREQERPDRSRIALLVVLGTTVLALLVVRTHLRNRVYRDATAIWSSALRIAPENDRACANLAMHYRTNGDLERAIELCHRAISINPRSILAYSNLAEASSAQGNADEAVKAWQRVVEISPDFARGRYELAVVLARQGDWPQVIRHLQEYLGAQPDHARAHYGLAVALQAVGRVDQAVTHFRRAVELEPETSLYRKQLDQALHQIREEQRESSADQIP